jgi:DNA-binding NarL/FixJ family response regulator
MLRVLVVENSDVLRIFWRSELGKIPGILITQEESRADRAIDAIHLNPPDIVLLDIELVQGNGMEVLKAALADHPEIRVIVVTNYGDEVYRKHYLREGAYAFYDKSYEIKNLKNALQQLALNS